VALPRFRSLLMSLFAATALLLAAVGIYGVTAYSVAQRTQEIGVRIALGATASGVLRLVIGQGGRLASVGIALGLIGAIALTRVLERMLFGVSASDTLTFRRRDAGAGRRRRARKLHPGLACGAGRSGDCAGRDESHSNSRIGSSYGGVW
jgi:hypothetical protein